jgi:RNA polymerase sigma-70 factor (ECF subfamily)
MANVSMFLGKKTPVAAASGRLMPLPAGSAVSDKGGIRLFLVGSEAMPESTDADLVAAWGRGNPSASSAIWGRFYPLVRRVLCRSMGPGQDVDDLIQEVFLRLFRKLPSLRDPAALRSFVLSIATHVVQGELRGRWFRRWLGLSSDGKLPEGTADDPDHEAREALDRFYGILDRLSAKDRATFVLRHVEELELTDVAGALGVSLATVKRRLPRVTKRVFALAAGDPVLAGYLSRAGREVRNG